MAIDIRAAVNCSLGALISGSINDDYLQGTGLVKTRGSVELSGLYTPALGTAVEFSYTRNGITTYLPRKLRVLSSFADPYRRTTRVELGCKLTYLADKKDKLKWSVFDEPYNYDPSLANQFSGTYMQSSARTLNDADTKRMPATFYARSLMQKCLTELGITASQNPLENRFVREQFDFSAGYVQVLSDLLVSESYVGYLNRHEVLQVISLDQDGGTGRVIGRERIIDLGAIGAGQLPGEAVVVSYTTYQSRYDDGAEVPDPTGDGGGANWTRSTTTDSDEALIRYTVPGSGGQTATATYPTQTTDVTLTTYRIITTTAGERVNVVDRRVSTRTQSAVDLAGEIAPAYLSAGVGFENPPVTQETVEVYAYDNDGLEVRSTTTQTGTGLHVAGALNLPMAFPDGSVVPIDYGSNYTLERTVVETERIGTATQTTTRVYVPWYRTIAGQQSIAAARDSFTTAQQVNEYIAGIGNGLYLYDVKVTTDQSGYRGQRGPSESDIPAASAASADASPDSNWRVESESNLALAVGSMTAQRRVEFSLPYAADDAFVLSAVAIGGGGGGGSVTGEVVIGRRSPAARKARTFGRVQNKLLAGNRSGMSLQCAAGTLPNEPFGPFVVEANGLSALYRANGSGWTFDANGIIHSTDALFWGAVGGTGDFWFPVAPGITTLPTTPAVVDTTPTAMVGAVADVGANPQATLSAAFPSATTGQGALDQATGNVYSKDASGNWINVGPNPGPSMTAPAVVPIWSETLELSSRIRLRTRVTSLPYALELPVVPLTARVRVRASVRAVVQVAVPVTELAIAPQAPAVAVNVPVPAAGLAIAGVAPAVTVEVLAVVVAPPVTSLAIEGVPPVVEQIGVNALLPVVTLMAEPVAPVVDTYNPNEVLLPFAGLDIIGVAPTVAQADPHWSSVSLLLSFDGTNGSTTITDDSSNANTISVFGTAAITTADKQYGTGSLNINNSAGAYVQTPASALFQFGTGNFTVELWANPASNQGNQGLFTFGGTATGLFLAIFNGNWMLGTAGSGGTNMGAAATGWQHVAITRSGTSLRLFIGGVQKGSTLTNSTNLSDNQLKIGYYFNTSYPFNGKQDEFRVTKGVARYTAGFTAPGAAFPRG